jgi:hypothetical protein
MLRRQLFTRVFTGAVAMCALLSCADSSAPAPGERYELQTVNDRPLPYFLGVYSDQSYDEISQGSISILSGDRLIVTATRLLHYPNGTLESTNWDTVGFHYVRSDKFVVLTYQDADFIRVDTLEVGVVGEKPSLRARTDAYRRPSMPVTFVRGALYVK